MNKFCKRLRYSVGGTYRESRARQKPQVLIREAHASSLSSLHQGFSTDGFLPIFLSAARFTPIKI